jgi:catechol 2,3-dioxygenase
MSSIEFKPRRLGHINLYVSELERSIAFYEQVCGIELVRREPEIRGGFHSNGNTHHDIGLIEVACGGADRLGRDGKIQITAARSTRTGLNHLGWEMENEAELVAAYKRFRDAGNSALRLSDHIISHSVYLTDPDGNVHEFYADAIPDWRQVFNLEHEDLVTSEWDPLAEPPSVKPNYPREAAVRSVKEAPLHPIRITGATLTTHRFDEMQQFFTGTAGLALLSENEIVPRSSVFAGACGEPNLSLVEVSHQQTTGLRTFSFAIGRVQDLGDALHALAKHGVPVLERVENGERRSIVIADPDEFRIEFCSQLTAAPVAPLLGAGKTVTLVASATALP